MNATALNIALCKPIITFVPAIPHDSYRVITLTATVNEGTRDVPIPVKRKEEVYFCEVHDVEYILRTIHEFEDVLVADRLDLESGPKRYSQFRKCLGGTIRNNWDVARRDNPATIDGFNASMQAFIAKFVKDTDLADQKQYLDTLKKPFSMDVKECADRLIMMNIYMAMFPGANGNGPYNGTDIGIKPNVISYNAAIRACGNGGQLEKAIELLHKIHAKYGIKPDTIQQ